MELLTSWWYVLAILSLADVTTSSSGLDYTLDIRMNKVVSQQDDDLVCTGRSLEEGEAYIIKLTPHAAKSTAHHMMLYGCSYPANDNFRDHWQCPGYDDSNSPQAVCGGGTRKILFAWALDAPEKALPEGVGIRVGGETGIQYLVTQLHYAKQFPGDMTDSSGYTVHMTRQIPEQQAGYLILGSQGYIPPQLPAYHMESYCVYSRNYTIYPIGYRTHSHNLGVVTSGYRVRDGEWTQIGRMSPQLPQTFYPVSQPDMDIRPGDVLAGRCTMNSMNRSDVTQIGPRNEDEMCNFYIMYSTFHHGVLADQFCFSRAPDFTWTQVFPPADIPADASSLEGIPGAGVVRDKFNLKPKRSVFNNGTRAADIM